MIAPTQDCVAEEAVWCDPQASAALEVLAPALRAGEVTYRLWRAYLAGSAQGFRTGRIGIYQSLLARPLADGLVELLGTRRDLYAGEVAGR